MRNTDGERRTGRYIKVTNAKLIDSLALYKFSFEEICENPIAHRDNPSSNIIRAKLHERATMEEVVLDPEGLNKDLRDEDNRMPILQPVDFTNEWKKRRARNTTGPVRIDDDEDLDYDAESEAHTEVETSTHATASLTKEDIDSAAASTSEQTHTSSPHGSAKSPEEVQLHNFQAQKKTIDAVGKAIQNINQMSGDEQVATETPAATAGADPFIPMNPNPSDALANQEANAINEYKARAEQQAADPKVLQSQYETANATGYQDGFKVGEEKAIVQMQASVAPLLGNIASIVTELEHVKKTILENVQQNFYEITQAIAETLIRREINVSPQAFASVIRQAIADVVPDDKITIAVHSSTHESLSKLEIPDLMTKVVKDDQVQPGDFRIDSSLSVVDGNISKLIANLIEQADLQLFEKTDKAG